MEEGGGDSSILSPTKSISGIDDVSLNVSLNATAESISLSQVLCCSVLQSVAVCCRVLQRLPTFLESCVVLQYQCVAVCCNG